MLTSATASPSASTRFSSTCRPCRSDSVRVTVFEADDRAGGKIRTNSDSGFLWDEGANTMTESALEASRLIDDLGLQDKQQYPNSQHKRYTVKDGAPTLIPSDPIALMKSTVLSTKSKFKLFLEPFLYEKSHTRNSQKVSDNHLSESVGSFFERHFGKEVVDYLIDPFVAGTSAGDPESLSIRHAFPGLWDLEKKYGSIIVGAILSKLTAKGDSTKKADTSSGKGRNKQASFSFHGGMQTLVEGLHKDVGDGNVKLGTQVLSLACSCDRLSASDGWSISVNSKDASSKLAAKNQLFDAVIMTAPLSNVQRMKFTKGGVPFVLDFLPKVDYLPLSLMVTAFRKEDVKRPLEGFGVLIPYKEQQKYGLKTLGTLFSSMMFPDRAPNDQHLFTTFVGGSHNRDLAAAPTAILKQLVTSDLRKLLGVEGQPTFVKHVHWKNAFPLYGHDYDLALEAIGKMENELPGFFYAGNNKDGLAVGNVIASGSKTADLVISYLESHQAR
ncbi:protoporphyrinogen oxidase 2, chloroplastic/mitochondrial isoform X2 [Brachypodium distachyon]|uniref:protoporphyrinogen oxidase 2, chloroplastic/mitochondrial isoform X2 n=1 Tax=Brachypodium distachyon TaxID=15368 RepID=UPI000D0DA9D6|nr:protoporphyrinogen oxidase 2, chloroplastic/mitochondrial isoform X2 [Brachypodium distachyon]|eukprot:XP_024311696.1 protoporphyrinogen oxidase 2, chloroplastic/mitochondrial isoform X2 [Brachypodium distachyon]